MQRNRAREGNRECRGRGQAGVKEHLLEQMTSTERLEGGESGKPGVMLAWAPASAQSSRQDRI